MATSLGIAYNKNTQEVLENLGQRVTFPSVSTIALNHDVRREFVGIYLTKDSSTINRISDGDEFVLKYSNPSILTLNQSYDTSGNEISAGTDYDVYEAIDVDFSPENYKNWLKIYVESKVSTSGDTITEFDTVNLFDIVNIKIESWLPDLSEIDISDNSTMVGIIKHPQMNIPVKITLKNGVCTALHQFGTAGRYQLPEAGIKIPGYRISEYLNVDVYMEW